jgi:hypothetical protein
LHTEKLLLPLISAADPHLGGVMVLVARFTRVSARFGQDATFTLRLKVGSLFLEIWLEIGKR